MLGGESGGRGGGRGQFGGSCHWNILMVIIQFKAAADRTMRWKKMWAAPAVHVINEGVDSSRSTSGAVPQAGHHPPH